MSIKLSHFLSACFLLLTLTFPLFAAPEPIIRVGLKNKTSSVEITFPNGGEQRDEKNRRIKVFKPGEKFVWQNSYSHEPKVSKAARSSKKTQRRSATSLIGRRMRFYSKKDRLLLNAKGYRGMLEVSFSESGAVVVNYVNIEDYLYGVVGSEISSTSAQESLKAQAVIARTWALANRNKHAQDGFDLCDKEHCQVYGGLKAERPMVTAAVNATKGIVLYCDGAPISAMYHAACGGMTSNNEDVYGSRPTRYLRRVRCNYCKNAPKYRWTVNLNESVLRSELAKEGLSFKELYSVETLSPARLDRVDQVRIQTDQGELRVKGTTFRRLFNLPSTTFVISSGKNCDSNNTKVGISSYSRVKRSMFSVRRIAAPSQLIIQSAEGIKRAKRPAGGWAVIDLSAVALDTESDAVLTLKQKSSNDCIITIYGRGYGHQLGLCQSGAMELGKMGWSYRRILALYYSNVSLRVLPYVNTRR